MRIANRQFAPTLYGTLATLLLLPVFLSLGFWQLRRADEKQALRDRLQAGASTTQFLSASNVETLPLFQTVVAQGRYGTQQVLLDNMWSSRATNADGTPGPRPGVNVLTPLRLEDGSIVLVNRGWLPFGRTRADLPNVAVEADPRSVRGRVSSIPQPGVRLGNNANTAATWPRLLTYPTFAELQALYGRQLLPRIVLLDPAEPDGYERDWAARFNFDDFGPDRHIGYAVQWFGFAFTLVVIYVVVSLKPMQSGSKR